MVRRKLFIAAVMVMSAAAFFAPASGQSVYSTISGTLAEDQLPLAALWNESLISSRLLEYELWNRIYARKLGKTHGDAVRELIGRIALIELISPILDRAKEPFPSAVRTLDSLHLASIVFLIEKAQSVSLAS